VRPNLSVVTLGVRDFKTSLRFYKNVLGWPTSATEKDPIAFFELNGTVLAIFGRESLAEDATVDPKGSGFSGMTLGHNARSAEEVDEIFRHVTKSGGKVVKKPRKTSWGGYSGYFADPDEYLWEVVYNPGWRIDAKGGVHLA
jgi:uncharacterized protein